MQNQHRQEPEKRKPEEHSHHQEAPHAKRMAERTSQDIRDIFRIMNTQPEKPKQTRTRCIRPGDTRRRAANPIIDKPR